MSHSSFSAEERFAEIVETFVSEAAVTFGSPRGKGFGSSALKVENKIFAMLFQGKLVVKLPVQRVEELIATEVGERFNPGHGRLMKEWLTVEPTSDEGWLALAKEAKSFVAARH